jgi:hypothetical protein
MAFRSLVALAAVLALSPSLRAESHNPTDYPLRIHIYGRNQTTFYQMRQTDEAKGEGRANLYEGGEPKGIDFQFDCDHRLQVSSGFETFPAKWKKPGQELVILQPEFGKPGSYDTCRFKVMVKDFVYVMHNGALASEPQSVFKQWMTKHEYDPEHGKNAPTAPAGSSSGTGAAPTPSNSNSPAANSPH